CRWCFDLNVLYRRPLSLSEVAHLRLSEFDVINGLGGELGETALNLLLGQAKEGGFHLSNLSEISRRAVSPRLSISSMMPVTMSRTFFASAVACSGGRPVFRYRAILPSSQSSPGQQAIRQPRQVH